MSTTGQTAFAALEKELQNELFTANQLIKLISVQLEQIKQLTSFGGEFESVIKKNVALLQTIANRLHINLDEARPVTRSLIPRRNATHGHQHTDTVMGESQ